MSKVYLVSFILFWMSPNIFIDRVIFANPMETVPEPTYLPSRKNNEDSHSQYSYNSDNIPSYEEAIKMSYISPAIHI